MQYACLVVCEHMFATLRPMEPATFSLTILRPTPPEAWERLRSELDAQGAPPIVLDRAADTVAFACQTGAFMLRARVYHALDAVWGHGESRRLFRAAE